MEQMKMDALRKELNEVEDRLEELRDLNQALIIKEREANDELQECRNELKDFLKDLPLLNPSIGIKRMGELDYQLITASAEKKYPDASEAVILAKVWNFISLAEDKLMDPNWYPFKMINVGGEYKKMIDEEDDCIKGLKNELGDEAYDAVVKAITEIMDYNPSGRNSVPELWNFREERRVTSVECLKFIQEYMEGDKQKEEKLNH